jgi:hypothetical protein
MIQRRQDAQLLKQLRVIVMLTQPEAIDLPSQADTGIDGRQGQLAHAVRAEYFMDPVTVYQTNATLAIAQFELY